MKIVFCGTPTKVSSIEAGQRYVLSLGGSRFTHKSDEWLWDRWSGSWTVRRLSSVAPERAYTTEDRVGLQRVLDILA